MNKKILITLLGLNCTCHAGLSFLFDSGAGSGDTTFNTGGSWTGNGTVNDIDSSTPSGAAQTLVSSFSGTGSTQFTNLLPDPNGQPFADTTMSVTNDYTLVGTGFANLDFDILNPNSGLARTNRTVVTLLDNNTSSFTYRTTFSSPLHAISDATDQGDFSGYFPWLGSVSKLGGGDIDATIEIMGIQTVSDYSVAPTAGIDGTIAGSTLMNGIGSLNEVGENLSLSITNLGDRDATSRNRRIAGIRNVFLDGTPASAPEARFTAAELSDNIINRGEELYATTFQVTITPSNGLNFDTGTQFLITLDGAQGADAFNSTTIPEPSVSLISVIGFMGFLFKRKRK